MPQIADRGTFPNIVCGSLRYSSLLFLSASSQLKDVTFLLLPTRHRSRKNFSFLNMQSPIILLKSAKCGSLTASRHMWKLELEVWLLHLWSLLPNSTNVGRLPRSANKTRWSCSCPVPYETLNFHSTNTVIGYGSVRIGRAHLAQHLVIDPPPISIPKAILPRKAAPGSPTSSKKDG